MTSVTRALSGYKKLLYYTSSDIPDKKARFRENLKVKERRIAELSRGRFVKSSSLALELIDHLENLPARSSRKFIKIKRLFHRALAGVKPEKEDALREKFEKALTSYEQRTYQRPFESLKSRKEESNTSGFEGHSTTSDSEESDSSQIFPIQKQEVYTVESLSQVCLWKVFQNPIESTSCLPADLAEKAMAAIADGEIKFARHHIKLLALTPILILRFEPSPIDPEHFAEILERCSCIETVVLCPPWADPLYGWSQWGFKIGAILDFIERERRLIIEVPQDKNPYYALIRIEQRRLLVFWNSLTGEARKRCLYTGFKVFNNSKLSINEGQFSKLQKVCLSLSDNELKEYAALIGPDVKAFATYLLFLIGNNSGENQRKLSLILENTDDLILSKLMEEIKNCLRWEPCIIEVLYYHFHRLIGRMDETQEMCDHYAEELLSCLKEKAWQTRIAFLAPCVNAKFYPILFEAIDFHEEEFFGFLKEIITKCSLESMADRFKEFFLRAERFETNYLMELEWALDAINRSEQLSAILEGIPEEASENFRNRVVQTILCWGERSIYKNLNSGEIDLVFQGQRRNILEAYQKIKERDKS